MRRIISLLLAVFFTTMLGAQADLNRTASDIDKKALSIVDYLNRKYGKVYANPLPMITFLDNKTFYIACMQNISYDCDDTDAMYVPIEGKDHFGVILLREPFDLTKVTYHAALVHEFVHWIQHIEGRGGRCGNEVEAYNVQNEYLRARGYGPVDGIPERCTYAP